MIGRCREIDSQPGRKILDENDVRVVVMTCKIAPNRHYLVSIDFPRSQESDDMAKAVVMSKLGKTPSVPTYSVY